MTYGIIFLNTEKKNVIQDHIQYKMFQMTTLKSKMLDMHIRVNQKLDLMGIKSFGSVLVQQIAFHPHGVRCI